MAAEEDDPKLILLTGGGLCNRLRPVLSAMRIADQTGRRLYVHWNVDQSVSPLEQRGAVIPADEFDQVVVPFPGDWSDYFAVDISRSTYAMCTATGVMECRQTVPRDYPGNVLVRGTPGFLRFNDEPELDFLRSGSLTFQLHRIKSEIVDYVDRLRPVRRLKTRIDRFAVANGIDGDAVGVHIRSNHPYCGRATLSEYFAVIDAALTDDDVIFLASDSEAVDRAIVERYGRRVVAYPKRSRDRDGEHAIDDAVVDLFLLGKTGRLIGSEGSSFSDMAWWIGKCSATNYLVRPESSSDSRRESSSIRKRNLFVFAVAGDEHVATVNRTLPFLKQRTKSEIVVVKTRVTVDLSPGPSPPARGVKVDHDQVLEVSSPSWMTDRQAAISLKTSLATLVGEPNRSCCYLDSDVVAVDDRVDTIFSLRQGVVTFAQDHTPVPDFSRHCVNCGCPSGECGHLRDAILDTFGVDVVDERWRHWNGGVFLFDSDSAEFMRMWHAYTMLIFDDPYWKVRDQGTLIAAAWKMGLQGQGCLPEMFNFIVDPFWGVSMARRQGLKAGEFTVNRAYSLADAKSRPSMLHFINGGVGKRGWKNWDDVERGLGAGS